ncbi:MAG: hypothetical protein JNJ54_29755 [Myxococcaceae bacterium]|nr:hypothetical protein [Myxococcaceae bacterium]
MKRGPPRLLPGHVPDLPPERLEPYLNQRCKAALMSGHSKGTGGWWNVPLENLGGPGVGLVVELRGLPTKLVEFGVATASFGDGSDVFTSARRSVAEGVRFTFDDLPLTRRRRAPAFPAKKAKTARGQLEQLVRFELSALVRRTSPSLEFVFRCHAAPPRRAVPFTLRAWPKAHPEGGFTMGAWFGHQSLWSQFG